jgi:hypothetical protein
MVGYFREALRCSGRMISHEPLAALGYERKAVALIAMGRRAEAQEAWRKSADLGFEINLINHIFDYLLHGQDEEAMELAETLPAGQAREIIGMDAGEFRSFVESARDPASGRQYLRDTVPGLAASASNQYDATYANIWYLAFDALDDFYDAIYKMDEVDTSWTNSDMLTYMGRAFKSSGYTEDPRFTPLSNRWGMLDLWDERGPPDDCEKVDDNWVCN